VDRASVLLRMVSKTTDYRRVFFDFRLTDPATGLSSSVYKDCAVFNSAQFCWGTMGLMKISLLESLYVRNDHLVIECNVTYLRGGGVQIRNNL
jgi:hypothetical protein